MDIRQIDGLGRVCLPISYRKQLELGANDPVEIILAEDEIILRKHYSFSETQRRLISLEQSLCHNAPEDRQKELHDLFAKIHSLSENNN